MDQKRVTIGYLLWALAFLPAAVSVELLTGLPYFLAVYVFHTGSTVRGLLGFCIYLTFIIISPGILMDIDYSDLPSSHFFRMLFLSGIAGAFYFLVWCFGGMLGATARSYLLWLSIPAVILTIIYVGRFVRAARSDFRKRFAAAADQPGKRETPVTDNDDGKQQTTLQGQGGPGKTGASPRIVRNYENTRARYESVKEMPFPEEKASYMALVEDCEYLIKNGDSKSGEAAEMLIDLYKIINSDKKVRHISRWDHHDYDEYMDHFGCGGTEHHSDETYTDHYEII